MGRQGLAGRRGAFRQGQRNWVVWMLVLACLVFSARPVMAQSFNQWVSGFWPAAKKAGISWSTYKANMSGLTVDQNVLRLAKRQPEFVTPIWVYLEKRISDARLKNGRLMLKKHKKLLDRVEQSYGVSRYIVVAIWGMESSYGAVLKNRKVMRNGIRALATLAYGGGRLRKFGRTQLLSALKIIQRGDITRAGMLSSWAGAMGHTQFIPTSYDIYAVDFDGDGRRNVWTSIPDSLASTANLLKRNKWQTGKTWGYEVRLPRGFDYRLAGRKNKRSLGAWQALGVKRANGKAFPRPDDEAELLLPAGANGPVFLMLRNFRSLLAYNNATAYALTVGKLADRLLGGKKGFHKSWPEGDKPLSRKERVALQTLLNRKGFSVGKADGKVGGKTRAALRAYQSSVGLVPDGYPSQSVLKRLRR